MNNRSKALSRLRQGVMLFFSIIAASLASAATYYVSPSGSDGNSGTSAGAPFRRIQSALNRVLPGDTILLRGGTYREQPETNRGGAAGMPVTIAAYPGEIPVIKGSDVVTGWVLDSGSVWKKTGWPYNSQQVFVDFDAAPKKSLQQIGMPSKYYGSWEYPNPVGSGRSSMVPGSFYYDPASQTLYVQLADGSNPNNHTMEVSVRRRLLMLNQPYYVVNGIRFRHTSTSAFAQQGGAVELSSHSVIQHCDIQYADFAGLEMGYMADGTRADSCVISNNGSVGVNAAGSTNYRMSNMTLNNNNNRNFNVYWHAGGFKASTKAYGTVETSEMAYNNGPGVWFDHTNTVYQNIVRNNYVHDNTGGEAGIFYEVSDHGLIFNNVVVRNRIRGIYIAAGNSSQVYNNTIYGTVERAGIEVAGMPRDTATLKNNLIYNNIVSNGTSRYDLFLAAPNGTTISGNRSDYNVFYRSSGIIMSIGGALYSSLPAWIATGNDGHSYNTDPRFASPGSSARGFAITSASPGIDKGVSFPGTIPYDYVKADRPAGSGYDIGAFEYVPSATTAGTSTGTDTVPPVVTLNSAVATTMTSLTLSATATDNIAVTAMHLYVDGVLKASSSNGVISYLWPSPVSGTHQLKIVANDAALNEGSATATLTIK